MMKRTCIVGYALSVSLLASFFCLAEGLRGGIGKSAALRDSVAKRRHGVLCLTFDDRNFAGWERALPLFRRFHAHATFFVCGPLDGKAVSTMAALRAEGHSLGLHGQTHAPATKLMDKLGEEKYLAHEVLPQVEAANKASLDVRNWAYPMSARNGWTDSALGAHFRRLRTGCVWRTEIKSHPLCSYDEVFLPMTGIPERKLIPGAAFPSAFPEWEDDVIGALKRVRDRNELVCLYAHCIRYDAKIDPHDISIRQLESVLENAALLGVSIIGFDEL